MTPEAAAADRRHEVREAARGWRRAAVIEDATLAAVVRAYPDDRVRLGPAFRGYFSDNCRTFAVNRQPTDEQQTAWTFVMKVFKHLEATAKPGKNCNESFDEAQAILNEAPVGVFNHHLGHGIGLNPHEGPHLNPHWNDTFEVGDVFTAEPGLYDEKLLRAGMRLENDYLVTPSGIENLSPFPMELA